MRLGNYCIIFIMTLFSPLGLADNYWIGSHYNSHDYGHYNNHTDGHYNRHHYGHHNSHYPQHELDSDHDYRSYTDVHSLPDYSVKGYSPHYLQEKYRQTDFTPSNTKPYTDNRDNDKDFYYFKNTTTHSSQPLETGQQPLIRTSLPLSNLDVEDRKRKRKRQHKTLKHSPKITPHKPKPLSASLALNNQQCLRKLRHNKVSFTSLSSTWGIRYPVKIHSTIGGVRYRHHLNKSTFSIMDCRLAASLIGWSKILKKYDIYEVVHMRIYSPGATVKRTGKPSGHRWGLAIDVAKFKSHRYGELNVKYDWSDRRRKISPCIQAPNSAKELKLLRAIVCTTANQSLFAMILTPHYNRAHHDHLHIELRPQHPKLVLR